MWVWIKADTSVTARVLAWPRILDDEEWAEKGPTFENIGLIPGTRFLEIIFLWMDTLSKGFRFKPTILS
jgi:hypothetical protein